MSAVPAEQSVKLISGTDTDLEFTVTDSDGSAVDLTGGSGRFAAARRVTDAKVIDTGASPTVGSITIVNASTGRVNVTLSDTETDSLEGSYLFEFQWTNASGRESVIARGTLTFIRNMLT